MANKKKRKKSRRRNPTVSFLLTLGIVICLCVMGYSAYQLITTALAYRAGREEYDSLREFTTEAGAGSADTSEADSTSAEEAGADSGKDISAAISAKKLPFEKLKAPISVDFDSLKKINEDIVGWLYIPSLDISYPVVHGTDDDYYLHRTFARKDNFAGSIFIEAKNHGDFQDPNTIIYGHNMNDGSMFGKLSRLTSEEKYQDDPNIWILTPDQNYQYEMFSLHVTKVDSSVYTLFTGTDHRFISWALDMQSQSKAELKEHRFSLDSRVISLSTCTTDSSTRYVVQAVRVKGDPPPEGWKADQDTGTADDGGNSQENTDTVDISGDYDTADFVRAESEDAENSGDDAGTDVITTESGNTDQGDGETAAG